MLNRRRLIIIISSVALGSLFAAAILRQRYGQLKPENFQQLLINFLFAIAIVVGIGILLTRTNRNKDKDKK